MCPEYAEKQPLSHVRSMVKHAHTRGIPAQSVVASIWAMNGRGLTLTVSFFRKNAEPLVRFSIYSYFAFRIDDMYDIVRHA